MMPIQRGALVWGNDDDWLIMVMALLWWWKVVLLATILQLSALIVAHPKSKIKIQSLCCG